MMKSEFEEMSKVKVSDNDYEVIQTVYGFHPAIKDTTGKAQVVALYKACGMAVFHDMLESAKVASAIETEMHSLRDRITSLGSRLKKIEETGCADLWEIKRFINFKEE